MIRASIITIGDELLIGQVVDTNSAFIARMLNTAGITVNRRVAVGDTYEAITSALDEEISKSEVVLLTGGLGPTSDDITKPLLCAYFNARMTVNQDVLHDIRHLFEVVMNKPPGERNLKQAEVPDICEVIRNRRGTAPGMLFEKNGRIIISMPGVPYEMMGMMEDSVLPLLLTRFKLPEIIHFTCMTTGIGESQLADHIVEFENNLPEYIRLAYLPYFSTIRLRLSSTDSTKKETLNQKFSELLKYVQPWLAAETDTSLENIIAGLLTARKQTFSTAESCTGGYISHKITLIPGASAYFKGGVVSYSNQSKTDLLHVPAELFTTAGAVSMETVHSMVAGALDKFNSDYAIAVSGVLGPGGGTPEKPVGTVWIAVGNREKTISQKFSFRFDRQRNIEITAINALDMLRKFILGS